MGKKLGTIDGIIPSVAKRILKYAFNGYFFKLEIDNESKEYKVWMKEEVNGQKINEEDILYFKKHFRGFNFRIIPENISTV